MLRFCSGLLSLIGDQMTASFYTLKGKHWGFRNIIFIVCYFQRTIILTTFSKYVFFKSEKYYVIHI